MSERSVRRYPSTSWRSFDGLAKRGVGSLERYVSGQEDAPREPPSNDYVSFLSARIVENLKWDENDTATRKKDTPTLNRNVRSQGVQVGVGACKDIGNFTCALENLELESEEDQNHTRFKSNDAQTNYFNVSKQEETAPVFKTWEKSTFQLVLQGPDILNFQGTRHSPADIAPYWKKDCRMWLWKSVRLARKIRRTKAKAVPPLHRKELL
ncbi:PREDICTED: uncharacterized protein LOC106740861 [Dinoponera quadriceps]|uniref:Uncharacterized protein LOC106740861 n=1 Tax=Dinoponera quadriceps TaxID=609295 RepID=A0A6P3WP35_DINQU|nr:PREDICTED: uncharacterized protein LOC106740861 [Dinoponera quadriceps]